MFRHRCQLVGVCDVDRGRAEQAVGSHAVPTFGSLRELLAGVKLDAVYIATPDDAHLAPVQEAAAAGVHMLIEKPLATTVADAEAIAAAVARGRVTAEVNFSNHWNPPFVAAKKSIEAGDVGDVLTFNSRLNNTISSPTQRLAWAGRTTSAWFLLSHVFDLARWLGGKRAVSVYASGIEKVLVARGVTTYDCVHALVKYDDGTDGVYESAWVLPESLPSQTDFKYEIIGTKGALFVDTHDQMIHEASATYKYPSTLAWSLDRFAAFLIVLETGAPPDVPVADGVENTKILAALHRSIKSGAVERVQ